LTWITKIDARKSFSLCVRISASLY